MKEVVVSPDGASVYVIAEPVISNVGVIAHFRRSGRTLSYQGCLSTDGSRGCLDLPGSMLRTPGDIAISPDGSSVYVSDFFDSAVVTFARNGSGDLSFGGCITGGAPAPGGPKCVETPPQTLGSAAKLAVSPDGTSVYGASTYLIELNRSPSGLLTFGGCIGDGSPNCTDLPGSPMPAASDVAVRPDGGHVYLTSRSSGGGGGDEGESVLEFSRDSAGQLFFDGCIADTAVDGCTDLPATPITDPTTLAIAPGGNSLYVGSFGSDAVSHFAIAPGGQLTFSGCVADAADDGCATLPAGLLSEVRSVVISGDGASLYAANVAPGAISTFALAPDGRLTYSSCVGVDNSRGCTTVPTGALATIGALAVSPDGASLFGAGAAFSSFARRFDDDPPETELLKAPKKKTTKRKAKFKFASDEPTAGFECKLDKKPFGTCESPLKRKVKANRKHKFLVRAVDAEGNVDPTPAKAKWRVR